jgi:RHS repeat-associated protein
MPTRPIDPLDLTPEERHRAFVRLFAAALLRLAQRRLSAAETTTTFDISGAVTTVVNALNQVTTQLYDVLKQAIGSINGLGQQVTQVLDALGRTVASIDASNKVSEDLFNQDGEEIGTIDGLGDSTRQDFNSAGQEVRSVDANGDISQNVFDLDGRTVVTLDALNNKTTSSFDGNGNLVTYTDASGNTTTWAYDGMNRKIRQTDALGHSTTYAYDSRGRETSQTDALGRREDFTYDDDGRVLTETWVNADLSTADVFTFTYDGDGNALTAANYQGTYTQTFDNQDRLSTQAGLYGVSFTFTYDSLGRRAQVQDSFGGVLSSTYDAANELTKRQFGGVGQATLTYDLAWNASNQVLSTKRYSDLAESNLVGTTTFGYDAANQLISIQHKNGSGTNIAAYTYTLDSGGRMTQESRNGTNVTYSYDTTSQLTQAGAATYSYDATGNRTLTGYTTGGMNQLTNDGTFTYTYDLEGNVSTKSKGTGLEKWYYGYDQDNRLLSVRKTSDGTTNTLTVTYAYDVFGNRVKEDKWVTGGSVVTTKSVNVDGEAYLDLDGSNSVVMRYIRGDGRNELLARIDGSNVVNWYLTDRQGNIRDIIDNSAASQDSITYTAFGDIATQTNSANLGSFGAQGRRFDTGTKLLAADWRFLNVLNGQWIEMDQSGFRAGDPNLYRDVGNNPTNATDPSGLDEEEERPTPLTDAERQARVAAHLERQRQSQEDPYNPENVNPGYYIQRTPEMEREFERRLEEDRSRRAREANAAREAAVREENEARIRRMRARFREKQAWEEKSAALDESIRQKEQLAGPPQFTQDEERRLQERAVARDVVVDVLVGQTIGRGISLLAKGVTGQLAKLCFPAGTPVHTPTGLVAIEAIAPGDRVWAFDHQQLCWNEREVVEVYRLLHRGTMATIQVNGETVRATGGHPFWVVQGEGLASRPLPARIKAYEAGDGRRAAGC